MDTKTIFRSLTRRWCCWLYRRYRGCCDSWSSRSLNSISSSRIHRLSQYQRHGHLQRPRYLFQAWMPRLSAKIG